MNSGTLFLAENVIQKFSSTNFFHGSHDPFSNGDMYKKQVLEFVEILVE